MSGEPFFLYQLLGLHSCRWEGSGEVASENTIHLHLQNSRAPQYELQGQNSNIY